MEVLMKKLLYYPLLQAWIVFALPGIPVQAEETVKQCLPSSSEFKPILGGWAEYLARGAGGEIFRMRVAVVDKEGEDFWYETVVWAEGRMITKVLASGDPNDEKNVKRMIVKYGEEPATEVPIAEKKQASQKEKAPQDNDKTDKGSEEIKVLAGTFTAKHFQYRQDGKTTDTWENSCVSPYGLIRLISADMEMVLLGYGTGARSLILEKIPAVK
jgi:hypothetical protein